MINENIARYKYWVADYPNLEDRAIGMVIPEVWGAKDGVTPVCVDTENLVYKMARRPIATVREVRADGAVLVENVDYVVRLEHDDGDPSPRNDPKYDATIVLTGSPLLIKNTTYWFIIEADYTTSGTNCNRINANGNARYANGQANWIDNTGAWSDAGGDIIFQIWGKESLDSTAETLYVEYFDWDDYTYWKLKESNAHFKIAQSFLTPGTDFYPTKIVVYMDYIGTPSGTSTKLRAYFMNNAVPKVQVGSQSPDKEYNEMTGVWNFTPRGTPSQLLVDIDGYNKNDFLSNVSLITQDIISNCLGWTFSATDFNITDFGNLETERIAPAVLYIDGEMTFGQAMQKLGAGHLFQFIPQMDGKYTVRFYSSADPNTVPHYFDEDFSEFKMERSWTSIFKTVKIQYDEDPSKPEPLVVEASSSQAENEYRCRESLTVDTALSVPSDALECAVNYLAMFSTPLLIVNCTIVGSQGFDLIPGDKIKITRSRAAYTGGALSGVKFRIMSISKNIAEGKTTISAVLDSQTIV